jgi:hypothetical protein
VCVETVESGKMTKDLAILVGPEQAWMTTEQFFEAIREEPRSGDGAKAPPSRRRANPLAPTPRPISGRECAAAAGSGRASARSSGALVIGAPPSTRPMTRLLRGFLPGLDDRVGNRRRSCTLWSSGSTSSPARERAGEDVGRGDRVLDREVDADAADRRHGVGGIADRQQARPVPAGQPVELDLSRCRSAISSSSAKSRGRAARLADFAWIAVDAARLDSLARALGDEEGALPIGRGGRSARPSARSRH